MLCDGCIHDEVCGAEGHAREALTFCTWRKERQMTVFRYFKNKIYSGGGYTECDNCKQRFSNTGFPMIHDAKYCPECGAKVIIKR